MSKLQNLRKKAGYSQKELSDILGMPKRTLQALEQGERDINKLAAETLYKMTVALGCDISDIIETEELKSSVYDGMATFFAEMEMDVSSHDDEPEDYDSELDFFLSQVSGYGYLTFLEESWGIPEEDTMDMQDRIIRKIKEAVDNG